MKPKRTHSSNRVFELPGGNEDNSLWCQVGVDEDRYPVIKSVFVPTDEERQAIANGANIELILWARQPPPIAMVLNDEPLGAA